MVKVFYVLAVAKQGCSLQPDEPKNQRVVLRACGFDVSTDNCTACDFDFRHWDFSQANHLRHFGE